MSTGRIAALERIGGFLFGLRRYRDAALYYSALLQLREGCKETNELFQRHWCALRLAVCDLKMQKYTHALARCSEVISESPPEIPTEPEAAHAYSLSSLAHRNPPSTSYDALAYRMGLAYTTRAKAFLALNMTKLAEDDLKCAIKYVPDEVEVYELIGRIESGAIHGAGQTTGQGSGPQAEFSEIVEDCVLQCPPDRLTPAQIRQLHRLGSRFNSSESGGAAMMVSPLRPSPLAALSALPGSGGRPGGLSAPALTATLAPLLGGVFGLDAASTRHLSDVAQAVARAWEGWTGLYRKYRRRAVTALSALWVVYALDSALRLYVG